MGGTNAANPVHGNEDEKHEDTSVKQLDQTGKVGPVTIFSLFPSRKKLDMGLLVLATVTAMATGGIFPVGIIVSARSASAFISAERSRNTTTLNDSDPLSTMFEINLQSGILCYVFGAVVFVTGYISFTSFACVAERQSKHIRYQFFRSVLRQNIAWFETHKIGELSTTFTEDILQIYEGIGIKLCNFLQFISTWLSAIIVGFVLGWKLALVGISFSPFILVFSALGFRYLRKVAKQDMEKYSEAGNIASETFTSIKTVHAFGGQEKQANRYDSNLDVTKASGGKRGLVMGLNLGIFWGLYFVDYAVLVFYAVHLMQTEKQDPGDMLATMVLVNRGSATLGFALPYIEILSNSLASAKKVFAIIDTVPKIDSTSQHGQRLMNVLGNIEFRNVCFSYPSRGNVQVLRRLNLTVPQGKVVALVGPSGSGKSTIVQLLQRFYDPLEGQVCIDSHDIRDMNVNWLRHQFGVVSQEPVLFDTTISENIRYGNMDIDQDVVEKAAREANAHDFISQLPQGYATVVGDRGAQLSGGQKQRIAIARALVRDPKILLLDEATSALDQQSEALVQDALEKAKKGRTTLVIAHRLSTVKNADIIVTISHGQVVEQGTHQELLTQNGVYSRLVTHQTLPGDSEKEDDIQLQSENKYRNKDTTVGPLGKNASLKHVDSHRCINATTMDQQDNAKTSKDLTVRRLFKINAPECLYLLLGSCGAVLCGVTMPAFSIIISDFIRVIGLMEPDEQFRGTVITSIGFLCLGVSFALAKIIQSYGFAKSGAALTARIRSMVFRAIVNQDMDFFDEPENQVGNLTTLLSVDGQRVQLTTIHMGTLLEAFSTLTSILVVAFVSGWKLALAVVVFMPFLIVTGFIEAKLEVGFSDATKTRKCGKIFTEAVSNIRTVASLCREGTFLKNFEDVISHMLRKGVNRSFIRGLTHGSSLCLFLLTTGTALIYGSYLVKNEEMEYYEVYRIIIAVLFGTTTLGKMSSFHGDYSHGKNAAGRLFSVIDRPRIININSTQGHSLDNYSGALTLTNLWYRYKSRPSVTVLSGVCLDVQPGQTVALVGTSGSGKSTIIQLVERFYDVESGVVMADSTPLPNLDLKWWRSQLAVVSQEPVLFDCSIADNIAYGDNSRVVSMEEIIAAARMADIHAFIEALPLGYETNVGSHGTQLSGGQKQRVAIARALIRNPKVLLLDEATSSLDSESERIIQKTLDKVREGRTCIVIAHRLSTVQNSDKIAVLNRGEIIEVGSHSELLERKGMYFEQIQAQNKGRTESAVKSTDLQPNSVS